MQRRPINISAALAIAIERQVEDIIANARACALQYRAASHGGFTDPLTSGPRFPSQVPEADLSRNLEDALRPWSDFPRSDDPFAESTLESHLDIWMRLRSLFKSRSFRG